ncbi:MAG: beta-propeller fold lactonase family protein, partial [Bacteroidales bacterium]|nr:beta-propeller fold lactonase family protein [Bacteroidales bacterium]
MNGKKILVLTAVIAIIALLIAFPGRKWARGHVNYKTAVNDHPLMCTNCHLYISKNPLIKKIINRDYYSPLNLAVSKDGRTLFITASDGNALLVAEEESGEIISKIKVGSKPHSVILDRKNEFAYVSNQWSDNVSVIDLSTLSVCDTLSCGNGPAGLALSASGSFLYVVNSYSSDLSVIDLARKEEIKRLTTGNNPTGAELSPDGKELFISSRRAKIAQYGEALVSELTVVDDSIRRVRKYVDVPSAYLMENFSFTPDGDLAFFTMIRPKNLVPSIQVERGWMMTNGIGIV